MEISRLTQRMPGRPLSFNRDKALEKAMIMFWRHGYETTSIAVLTKAMGITPPSLYASFGDKKSLFLEAVNRYQKISNGLGQRISAAATAREAAWVMLEGAALKFSGSDTPPGCLIASAAISCSAAAADIQTEIASLRRDTEESLRLRIDADRLDGKLPEETDAEALAAHVFAVIQGMSTLARDGASREKLMRVATTALSGWPVPRSQTTGNS
jgi:AcrR family transcriptional regulator